jgi:branched-chain amino acid transport system substrate-binding protein
VPRQFAAIVALLAGLAVFVAACGGGDDNGGGGAAKETSTPAKQAAAGPTAKCGLGNGQKATGEPIMIGALATKQPGTDFSEIPRTTEAYFNCVNDNGGINGRPVKTSTSRPTRVRPRRSPRS